MREGVECLFVGVGKPWFVPVGNLVIEENLTTSIK